MRTLIASAISGLLLAAAAPLAAQEQKAAAPQPAAVTITVDVIDLSCRLVNNASGASHRECAQVCADKGQPLALLGTDGTFYMPVNAGMGAAGENARLRAHAEHRIRVKGRVIEKGSFKAIVVESIEMVS
jgi:hypothetical protein